MKFLFYLFINLSLFAFVACSEDSIPIKEEYYPKFAPDTVAIVNFTTHEPFYNEESLSTITIEQNLLNHLGLGYNLSSNNIERMGNILKKNDDLSKTCKITLDEKTIKTLIVSWDKNKLIHHTDSFINTVKQDTNSVISVGPPQPYYKNPFEEEINKRTLYVNLVFIKQFGRAELNTDNELINQYLNYETDKFDNLIDSAPNISASQFKRSFGNYFTKSIHLGNTIFVEANVYDVNCLEEEKGNAVQELVELLMKIEHNQSSWEEVKKDNKYFHNSDIGNYHVQGIGRFNIFNSLESLLLKNNNVEKCHQKQNFSCFSANLSPHTEIYPNYDFE